MHKELQQVVRESWTQRALSRKEQQVQQQLKAEQVEGGDAG